EILDTHFHRPALREIVTAFQPDQRQRRYAAFGVAHDTAADDRVRFDFRHLDAERGSELGALAHDESIAVRQTEHRQIELAVDALAAKIHLVLEDDAALQNRLRRAVRGEAAQA